MGCFLTGNTITKQITTEDGMYIALNNQLYMDDDGTIYLCPRNQEFDGYTIPRVFSWLAGGHFQWDLRCCREHDLNCKYHEEIIVKLSLQQLKNKFFLYELDGQMMCVDIPKEFLAVRKVSFNDTNSKFKRMMKATSNIKPWRIALMRFGVNFNIGWMFTGKENINLDTIYKVVL